MHVWTLLVAQWMRIHLSMQGTWAQGDPTCCRATKPLYHNDRAHRLQPQKPTCSGAHKLKRWSLYATTCEVCMPVLCNKRSHRNEKTAWQQRVAPACSN